MVDFWNLPSLPCLQGNQRLHAHRACHQVPGVQDHQQLQQHQALPGNRHDKLWFIFCIKHTRSYKSHILARHWHILILQDSSFSYLSTISSRGSSGSTGSHGSLRSTSSGSTRVTTLSLEEHTEGVSVMSSATLSWFSVYVLLQYIHVIWFCSILTI